MEELQIGDRVQCVSNIDPYVGAEGCVVGEWYEVKEFYNSTKGFIRVHNTDHIHPGFWIGTHCFKKEDPFITNFKEIIADGGDN